MGVSEVQISGENATFNLKAINQMLKLYNISDNIVSFFSEFILEFLKKPIESL